jgi:hypothetical protein
VSGLRGILFDNLGLKLVALLIAVLIYLNAYTDRPATMMVAFPVQVTDLPDSLTLTGTAPSPIRAELAGTGKQLIRLRVTEPAVKISLAGVAAGRFTRAIMPADLPLPEGVQIGVDRVVSPRTLELDIDQRATREIPVVGRLIGSPAADAMISGPIAVHPPVLRVIGPRGVLAQLDSLRLVPVSIAGRRDTLTSVTLPDLPAWCTSEPANVEISIPMALADVRRFPVTVEGVGADRVAAQPPRVTVEIRAPRGALADLDPATLRVRWLAGGEPERRIGRRVALRLDQDLPASVVVRLVPDSVTLVGPAR